MRKPCESRHMLRRFQRRLSGNCTLTSPMYETIDGGPVVAGRGGSGTSSWTVGERTVGGVVLPRELERDESRRMKRAARDLDLSLFDLVSSPEAELSVVAEGDSTFSLSRLKDDRRLLMDSRLWCVDEGRVGEREAAEEGRASLEGEVSDFRRSLIKSLTTVREDRRDLLSLLRFRDSELRPSLDMRRSKRVSLGISRAAGVQTGADFWWSTKRGDCLSSTGLYSDGSLGGSMALAVF